MLYHIARLHLIVEDSLKSVGEPNIDDETPKMKTAPQKEITSNLKTTYKKKIILKKENKPKMKTTSTIMKTSKMHTTQKLRHP